MSNLAITQTEKNLKKIEQRIENIEQSIQTLKTELRNLEYDQSYYTTVLKQLKIDENAEG